MITSNKVVKISKSNKVLSTYSGDRHKDFKISRKADRKNKQLLRDL